MRYLPFKPLFDLSSWWDEDENFGPQSLSGLNIYEEGGKVFVEAAVPGVESKDVHVTYEDGVLRISAKSEERDKVKKEGRVVHKWSKAASFEYTTYLPRPIDTKSIEAKVKDGVLTVSSKVAEEAKPKEIEVKAG